MKTLYKEVSDLISSQKECMCIALTGAGISAESGIPTFRSPGGLWEKYDPAVYASLEVFRKDPSKYWTLRGDFIRNYGNYHPNRAHLALADLEGMGLLRCVITQNIDGLHRKAGNMEVIEIHGSLRETYCLRCGREYIAPDIPDGNPPSCPCGGILKPNTVLYGEQLPVDALSRAQDECNSCGIMLLVGTSSITMPAAYLPSMAKQNNAKVVEINIEKAFHHADYFIKQKAGIALPEIVKRVKEIRGD